MRRLKNVITIFFIIIATYWLLQKAKVFPSLKDLYRAKPVVIDDSPILIKNIKSIGQLITYSFFDEVVADSAIVTRGSMIVNALNHFAPVPLLPSADKQLVLIGKGKVLAGTDLSLLNDTSVRIKNDTVTIYLPKSKLFTPILNPGDFETFIEKGIWTNEEVTQVKLKARKKMIEHALQQNILEKADRKAKTIIQTFLENMGYKNVSIL